MVKVIVDCDTGVDDALALCCALLSSGAQRLEVLAVTCVAGNGPIGVVGQATCLVLDACAAPSELPVALGFERGLVERAPFCPHIHGHDCLGDLSPPLAASERAVDRRHATAVILDTLRASPEPVTIVALAPLTNVAVAQRLAPELFREKVARVVWMGGGVSLGNFRATAEANAAYDPEAAAMLLQQGAGEQGVPITMYTWDAFLKVDFSRGELRAMGLFDTDGGEQDPDLPLQHGEGGIRPRSPAADLCARIMYREMRHWSKDTAVLGDAATVVILLDAAAFKTERCNVQVELASGIARGMTVVDRRPFVDPPDVPKLPANVDVVTALDVARVKRVFAATVFGRDRADLLKDLQEQDWRAL